MKRIFTSFLMVLATLEPAIRVGYNFGRKQKGGK